MKTSPQTKTPVTEKELEDARGRFRKEYLRLHHVFGGHDSSVENTLSPRLTKDYLGRLILDPLGSLLVKIGERLRAFRAHT